MQAEVNPRVLVVYFSLTRQVARVAETMELELEARGCDVSMAPIEFIDGRWAPQLKEFPMKRPVFQLGSILWAQIRHKTGEIQIPAAAQAGDYDLVIIASPTWWLQTSMPIRSYLKSPAAKLILNGKPFASASISRRYFSVNLRQQKQLAEQCGGRQVGKTHFVVAGGQVGSMLAWLAFMKHGEPQERALGLHLPPPNLQPSFEQQARSFVGEVVDQELGRPSSVGS